MVLARLLDDQGVTVTRIDPQHNARRFYRLRLQPDLLDGWHSVREWGRLGPVSRGRLLSSHHPTRQAAAEALLPEWRRRMRRGYRHLTAP